jgi:hypothetical protein
MENVIYKISLKSSINRRERGGEERNLNRLLKNKISLLELL